MTDQPSLFDRLKRARIVRVLVVYLGASYAVLQLVDTLKELLALPDWIGPITVILLGIGLLVIGATAWVQSLDSTTKAEEAGEVPTDWQIDTADAVASLKAGRLPHLTWGRAILGGVVAISLTIGAAGGFVLITGGSGLIRPTAAGAEGVPTAVAVLPFQVQGQDVELYGEGMVNLLTTNLEGLGGLRTINAGTVLARWDSEVGSLSAELDQALGVAGGVGARYAVRGNVLDAGGRIRVAAQVFDIADGARLDGVQVEGSDMLDLVDRLTVELASIFVGVRPDTELRSGAVTTQSLTALEAYLRGEALYRQMRFPDAIDAFREATAADSSFALAWWSLGQSWGWTDPADPEGVAASRRAALLAESLPARQRTLLRADADLAIGSRASLDDLREHVDRHPDDAEAWNALAEYAGHMPHGAMSPPAEFGDALSRAVEILPSFSPYYLHLAGLAVAEGQREELEELVRRMTAANPDDPLIVAWYPAWDFLWGTQAEKSRAEEFFRDAGLLERNVAALSQLGTDASERSREAADLFGRDMIMSTFPYMMTAVELSTGLRPEQWTEVGNRDATPNYLIWAVLTGESDVGRTQLSAAVGRGAEPAEAASAAVFGAWTGDETLRDAGLAALPDTAWHGPYGSFGGAADPEEARRSVEAIRLLREADAAAAIQLLDRTLAQDRYDRLTVYLRGEAAAALEDWPTAIRYWEVLIRTPFRSVVRIDLARAHEALGDAEAALEGYRGFLQMFEGADPSLRPVVEAREAVARLGG